MTWVVLALAGFAAAGVAAAWPILRSSGSAVDRADWVNRLFVLARQADAAGSEPVAAAARGLIAALVADKGESKKGA